MHRKQHRKNFVIGLELYPSSVMVSVGESDLQLERSIQRYTGRKKIKDLELVMYGQQLCEGKAIMFSSGLAVLRLRKMEWSVRDCAILQHELFHITHFIMRRISVGLNGKTHEAYAYLNGYLTEKIYGKLIKSKIKP